MRMRKGSAQDQWAGINDKVDGKKYINEMDVSTLVAKKHFQSAMVIKATFIALSCLSSVSKFEF